MSHCLARYEVITFTIKYVFSLLNGEPIYHLSGSICPIFMRLCDLPVCREYILKTAKALVEDTKMLVSGAGASQEKLAQAAQSSVHTITKLADVVKLGAASLGSEDPETQVEPLKTRQLCLSLL